MGRCMDKATRWKSHRNWPVVVLGSRSFLTGIKPLNPAFKEGIVLPCVLNMI